MRYLLPLGAKTKVSLSLPQCYSFRNSHSSSVMRYNSIMMPGGDGIRFISYMPALSPQQWQPGTYPSTTSLPPTLKCCHSFDGVLIQCSVSNSSSFGPGRFYRSAWQRPYPIKNRRFFKRTITLRPQILIREFSVWYVKYAAQRGASFGRLRFSISLNLSKRHPKNLGLRAKMTIISKQLAEFWRYQKSETAKRCAIWSSIFHVPNTKLSDKYSRTELKEQFCTNPDRTAWGRVFMEPL
jgi:hypothetical protein